MKNIKFIFPIFIALILVNSTFAQTRFFGTVTEVIDGRTIIVEPQPQVKVKIQLQYIEVPEAEQKLHGVVKTHLTNLVLNKYVEFMPKNLNETAKPVGQVLLNGVDISQQMLRDGAAWYATLEKTSQNETESKVYQNYESLAKNEKRGVWGIPDLKPAWEFRAEKEEKKRQEELRKKKEEKERLAKIKAKKHEELRKRAEARRIAQAKANSIYSSTSGSSSGLGIEIWQENTAAGVPKRSGSKYLYSQYLPQQGIEYTLTAGNFFQFTSGKKKLKIESRSLYLDRDESSLNLKDAFVFGFLTKTENGVFAKSNDLTIYADKKAIKLGKAYRANGNRGGMIQELLLYLITEKQLDTISKAKNVKVKLGIYNGSLDMKYKEMIKELVKSAK